jgi:hypothetical protein
MKISTRFVKTFASFAGILLLLAPLTVRAQTKVVVIPLFGDDSKPLKNIITVAKANGDFKDPVAAVNSITDASAENPYLVVIGPGVYTITQTLQMKEYVDIAGSGENVTKIKGAISTSSYASSAIIAGSNCSTLSSLTVENTGGGDRSVALYNNGNSPTLQNVTAKASGGTDSFAIINETSSPKMTDVTATGLGGVNNRGLYNFSSSSPTLTNVTATAEGGSIGNIGIQNGEGSSPIMMGVIARGTGDKNAPSYGIYSMSSSSSSSAIIRRSTVEGSTAGLSTNGMSTVTVSQSTILGWVSGDGTSTCVACDDGSGNAMTSSCGSLPPPPS